MSKLHYLGLWLMATVVLVGVFSLYLQPAFLFTLAQQVWSCF